MNDNNIEHILPPAITKFKDIICSKKNIFFFKYLMNRALFILSNVQLLLSFDTSKL